MKYLLDTNVVSELRRRSGDASVKRWVAAQHTEDLAISVVTVIEIETGILRLKRRDGMVVGALLPGRERSAHARSLSVRVRR